MNERQAGAASDQPHGWALLSGVVADEAIDADDEIRPSANVGQINARTARLSFERQALRQSLEDLRGMSWSRELREYGSIGGQVLA